MKNNPAFWDRVAFLYDSFIKRNKEPYETMYQLLGGALNKEAQVLEVATGTGVTALRIAHQVNFVEATDFSGKMIAKAKKKSAPSNVRFSVQDACALPYESASFDIVIIANALHVMPEAEKALVNIKRVLKPEGLLIAPNFVQSENYVNRRVLLRLMLWGAFRSAENGRKKNTYVF
ncbi:MAG: class I SAM-dependent methyltransferase [Syntrophomonadaceae bacterium]|jgi:ubiquinone/menaquinone biosynthesis C-methylase UbiE|nr:class I SAM-dependent methyltransferase [Syntrophomonadaceae bacterium]